MKFDQTLMHWKTVEAMAKQHALLRGKCKCVWCKAWRSDRKAKANQ